MIRYALKCAEGHDFESWFQSANAFDTLSAAGHLSCPTCGSAKVSKSLMAPRVATSDKSAAPAPSETDAERNIAALREKVEAESEYVGMKFAAEARAMHVGDVPTRAIYGEAKPAEAISLLEDGVPVVPLPFVPSRKAN